MTIEEAVQLVVQAGAVGVNGNVYVLDMGDPVRILDLATRLVGVLRPGADLQYDIIGLRPGEKLHEVLVGEGEEAVGRPHRLIDEYSVPSLPPEVIRPLVELADPEALAVELAVVAGMQAPEEA
jgi:FlaA1/EpsC-like NDP-sugar epimerase